MNIPEINGKAKTAGVGLVGVIMAALTGFAGTEATGATNLLGGLSKEQVLEICASHDQLRAVNARADDAWQLAGESRLNQLYEQEAFARRQLDAAIKNGDRGERDYWEREVRRIQAHIRKLGG